MFSLQGKLKSVGTLLVGKAHSSRALVKCGAIVFIPMKSVFTGCLGGFWFRESIAFLLTSKWLAAVFSTAPVTTFLCFCPGLGLGSGTFDIFGVVTTVRLSIEH